MKVTRALISVADKTGLVPFAKVLQKYKIDIISTGGTASLLEKHHIKVRGVSDYTGFPEILEGRVKTLHPKIYGGLLAKQHVDQHIENLKEFGIQKIDMVVVNLYPFDEVASQPQCTLDEALENIDIGGVSLLRAASKNFKDVIVVIDPHDYSLILEEMDKNGGDVSEETRLRLSVKALASTSNYDRHISNFLYRHTLDFKQTKSPFLPIFHLRYRKLKDLRYGENPHQGAALYIDESVMEPSIVRSNQLSGKALSFNNIYDLESGLRLIQEFTEPTCVIIKHNNPCGVGCAKGDIAKAFERAYACDSESAFGGIVICNQKVSISLAESLKNIFVEAVLAPAYDPKALAILKKKQNLRILTLQPFQSKVYSVDKWDIKKIVGGLLVQDRDLNEQDDSEWQVVSGKKPKKALEKALVFAWKVAKHVKSNAIVIASGDHTVGIGAGQMSRVDSVHLALKKAHGRTRNAVLASDAFFPFRDSMDRLKGSGIVAVIQPGGSIRDQEVIAAAKEQGITMVLTHRRHFKH